MSKANVLLIGTGGVGTVVACGLVHNGSSTVSVVVRRDYEKVKNDGWTINSVDYGNLTNWKPDNIYPTVEAAAKGQEFDYVVITTKNLPDVVKSEDVAEPAITPGKTTIILIQNGFDLGRPFIAKYPNNICLSGVSHIGSHNHNGVINQISQDKCMISYFENPNIENSVQEAKAKEFVQIYSNDKNNVTYFPDVKYCRYEKLLYNATMNTTCALTGVDTVRLKLSGVLESVSIPAMYEVIKVAKADGVDLSTDFIDFIVKSCDSGFFKPSMLVDVEKGNPIELEVILGNLLTVAKELKVETPTLTVLYNLLKATQFRMKEGKGLIKVPEDRPINDAEYN
ncbi:hypothetical protein DAPK24_031040 [Pichia kluyveri]|uniref:2-dehydropantoate 2-reductase n=1 Tax=Pichia kluyveri TaxID=36015 RepID=A0AAV5R4Y5_PICKL|nr:hypothetical protein DAPK24_031040 [Pichia kluyveri]